MINNVRVFKKIGKTKISCSHPCKQDNELIFCEICTEPHILNVKVITDKKIKYIGWCRVESAPKQKNGKPRICINCTKQLGIDVIEEI